MLACWEGGGGGAGEVERDFGFEAGSGRFVGGRGEVERVVTLDLDEEDRLNGGMVGTEKGED